MVDFIWSEGTGCGVHDVEGVGPDVDMPRTTICYYFLLCLGPGDGNVEVHQLADEVAVWRPYLGPVSHVGSLVC